MSQAAESLTVRGTAAGRRPFAMAATSTCTANGDVLFATGLATATEVSLTGIAVVVSTPVMAVVVIDKQTKRKVT